MALPRQAVKIVKRLALGGDVAPQQCVLGLPAPQHEVVAELDGLGELLDVTQRHMLACAVPFTVAIGFEQPPSIGQATDLRLRFRERRAPGRLLGELELRPRNSGSTHGGQLLSFTVRNCRNCCLPAGRLWAHYLYWAYLRRRRPSDVLLSMRDAAAIPIYFSCPRPVVLVSVTDGTATNLFPMNLMGPLGGDRFGFALNSARPPASLVKRAGRLALSAVPFNEGSRLPELGRNHRRQSVPWSALPFLTKTSPVLGLPVPFFALEVKELEVLTTSEMGSHTWFIARILHDERWAEGPQFFMIHGIYREWRQKNHCG